MSPTDDTPRPHNRWLPPLFRFLFGHRRAVLGLSLAAALLCLYLSTRLNMQENVLDLLPTNDPLIGQYRQILTDFNQLNVVLIDVGGVDAKAAPAQGELIGAADRLAERMQASALFKQITYRLDLESLPAMLQLLHAHRAALFTDEDRQTLEHRLAPDAIRQLLANWKRQLIETPAPVIAQALRRDPLGLDGVLLAKLSAIYDPEGPIGLEQGRLFSRDLKHLLIIAEPVFPSTDSAHAADLVAFMDRTIGAVERGAGARAIKIAYLCGHRFSLENARRIKGDLKLTLTICIAAIALISLLVYRRPLWVGLTFLPTLFGGLFSLGLLRILAPNLSAIAVGCGSMLMGIAVDMGIYILYHIDQISGRRPMRDEIIAIVDRLFWPLILCSGTTIVAFVSLMQSLLPGYRDLGWFAVFGFIGATLFAIFILPLMIPLRLRAEARRPLLPLANIFPPYFRWVARRRGPIALGLVAVTLAAAPGLVRLRFEGDYQKMNSVSPAVRQDWERIMKIFGSALDSTSFVVRGRTKEESLAANEKVYAALKTMQARGLVQSVQSVAPLLPSRAAQAENRRRWLEFWSPARVGSLRATLGREARALRMRPEAFNLFLESLPGPAAPLSVSELEDGPFGRLLAMVLSRAAGRPILTRVNLKGLNEYKAVTTELDRRSIPYVAYYGPQFGRYVIGLITREMVRVSAITIVLVLLILIAFYRSLRWLALIIAPLLLSLLWTFGVMGWLGLRINLMNSMVVVFIFGVVVDYAIFIATSLDRARAEGDPYLSHASVATLMTALTTMSGLGVLILARHPALRSIGVTSLLGIGTGLAAVFLLIPLSKRYPDEIDMEK